MTTQERPATIDAAQDYALEMVQNHRVTANKTRRHIGWLCDGGAISLRHHDALTELRQRGLVVAYGSCHPDYAGGIVVLSESGAEALAEYQRLNPRG